MNDRKETHSYVGSVNRRLFVIVKQNGQSDRKAGEAYANLLLTPQGQDLITKAGFVRIR
ncbi:periplasmic phosphate-binding protein of phosphate ABC transporter [Tolypothrix sp. NIES-4075]|nr:periplasmic phosphate-binding protein of phosphate ABC transporter [Tolypothrix sp. NIES-4075]